MDMNILRLLRDWAAEERYEPETPVWFDPTRQALVVECQRCGPVVIPSDVGHLPKAEAMRAIGRMMSAHLHPTPKPLTPDEREKIRVRGIHRRGALRLH